MREYTLGSPLLSLTFDGRPQYYRLLFIGWLALWTVVSAGLLYLYAVPFADWVGFETAVLVGVGLAVLASGDSA